MNVLRPLAVYAHWPFCVSKCPYCDFNSYAMDAVDQAAWAKAYAREIAHYAALLPEREVRTIYIGGGTPSLMEPATVEAILGAIATHWRMAAGAEITIEANPSSAEADKFAAFRAAGVNRLSLGVQSLRDDALRFLGRAHDAGEARRAIELAARHFPRFSFDLIYARAGQTLDAWEAELREALAFGIRHMSLYQLTIEAGTPFALRDKHRPLRVDEELAAAMFEATNAAVRDAGLPAYEISNYAMAGEESRHNLVYWRYGDYVGIGPGAHGRFLAASSTRRRGPLLEEKMDARLRGHDANLIGHSSERMATENHRSPEEWLRHVSDCGDGCCVQEKLDAATAQREALMMGLRLTEGISLADWQELFGASLFSFLPSGRVQRLQTEGLIETTFTHLRATAEGLKKLDAILAFMLRD